MHWFLSTQEWHNHLHLMIVLHCRCGLALFYSPASTTPPPSNQSSTRATLPSTNYIKTTNWDQRAALPTASITLTGVTNGWLKKNSGHRAHLTESLVRITGVTCHSIASVWLQEWFDQRSAMPRVTSIWIAGVGWPLLWPFAINSHTSSNNTDVLDSHRPSALSRNSTTDGLNSHDKLCSTTDHLGGLVTHDKLVTAMAVMTLKPNPFLSFHCSALPSRC